MATIVLLVELVEGSMVKIDLLLYYFSSSSSSPHRFFVEIVLLFLSLRQRFILQQQQDRPNVIREVLTRQKKIKKKNKEHPSITTYFLPVRIIIGRRN
jgi:hypothetical protein